MIHPIHKFHSQPHPREKGLKKFLSRTFPSLLGACLFIIALWALYEELHHYHVRELVHALTTISGTALFLSLLLTAASYWIKTAYDYLALIFLGRILPYRKIAIASFIGFALSNNIGLSVLPGASVRYRLYSPWGISGIDLTKIVFFYTLTLWLGFFLLGAALFLVKPIALPQGFFLPFRTNYTLGVLLLIPVLLYIAATVSRKGSIRIRKWEFSVPGPRFLVPQLLVSTLDWVLAGSVMFVLLPQGLPFSTCLTLFLVAQLAGIISQIPAGLGVYDAAMLIALARYFPASSIFASLIAYRALYYVLPLLPAIVMLAREEVLDRKSSFRAP